MKRKVKSRKIPTPAKMWLACWVIFLFLLPLQPAFAAMSCQGSAEIMACHCESNCTTHHKAQMGTTRQMPGRTALKISDSEDSPCDRICCQHSPLGEARIFSAKRPEITEFAGHFAEHNDGRFMPSGLPTSHSPPRAGRSFPFYIAFSSLLI